MDAQISDLVEYIIAFGIILILIALFFLWLSSTLAYWVTFKLFHVPKSFLVTAGIAIISTFLLFVIRFAAAYYIKDVELANKVDLALPFVLLWLLFCMAGMPVFRSIFASIFANILAMIFFLGLIFGTVYALPDGALNKTGESDSSEEHYEPAEESGPDEFKETEKVYEEL